MKPGGLRVVHRTRRKRIAARLGFGKAIRLRLTGDLEEALEADLHTLNRHVRNLVPKCRKVIFTWIGIDDARFESVIRCAVCQCSPLIARCLFTTICHLESSS